MHKRADIKTGYSCNNYCLFCVQSHNRDKGNRPKEDIFHDLMEARKTGCTGVVLTGGEVTIRDDFFDLLVFAKQAGFEDIQVQTNGRRFFYKSFCVKAVQSGMTEFAPAIHGHIPELHDYLTRSSGSFHQTIQGIRNVRELGVPILCNTVVVKPNYRYLPDIARLLVELKVDQFQFAFMHALGNGERNFHQMMPFVSMASPYIKEGLQIGIDARIRVMAEAMPFCVMEGYEKHVSELHIPDTEIRQEGSYDADFSATRKADGKVKFPFCRDCRFGLICEGPWKEYPERRGSSEFRPVPGTKVKGDAI